jgi:hypothetical protein
MADLAIITPSRDRPERLTQMLAAVERTAQLDVEVYVGLDLDDQSDYLGGTYGVQRQAGTFDVGTFRGLRKSLSAWTNVLAATALEDPNPPRYLASLGDDHLPRTLGWDRILIERIQNNMLGPGFAYGNDLLQGGSLPTAWVVSAEVVRALGWMMLPTCRHMYVDAAVRELGLLADRLWYEPEVIIEHVHPMTGKTGWDPSYRESNAPERYDEDRQAFERWVDTQLEQDAATLQALRY